MEQAREGVSGVLDETWRRLRILRQLFRALETGLGPDKYDKYRAWQKKIDYEFRQIARLTWRLTGIGGTLAGSELMEADPASWPEYVDSVHRIRHLIDDLEAYELVPGYREGIIDSLYSLLSAVVVPSGRGVSLDLQELAERLESRLLPLLRIQHNNHLGVVGYQQASVVDPLVMTDQIIGEIDYIDRVVDARIRPLFTAGTPRRWSLAEIDFVYDQIVESLVELEQFSHDPRIRSLQSRLSVVVASVIQSTGEEELTETVKPERIVTVTHEMAEDLAKTVAGAVAKAVTDFFKIDSEDEG